MKKPTVEEIVYAHIRGPFGTCLTWLVVFSICGGSAYLIGVLLYKILVLLGQFVNKL